MELKTFKISDTYISKLQRAFKMSFTNHDQIFAEAFNNANNLSIKLPDIDINSIIQANYSVNPPSFSMTKTQLWDMECRKAAAPDKYIPNQVRSAEKFPSLVDAHFEYFTRISEQKTWKDPSTTVMVIENVKIDHKNQVVTFIGAEKFTTPDERHIVAGSGQPLFNVEHGVVGDEENRPFNTWRITLLAMGEDDPRKWKVLTAMTENKYLPEYVEIYIREVLGVSLLRRED